MQLPTTVVITGSASGIGYGLARAFLARGCNVMLSDVAGERLEAAAAGLVSPGLASPERVGCQPCDVTHAGELSRLWSRAVERLVGSTFGSTTPASVRR
jgi:NAD(P)-dependent dehydrogenase (short-subunit alcohol dehydrogenase family)